MIPTSSPGTAIAREFDSKASTYESNRLSGWYRAHAEIVLDQVSFRSSEMIYDIGCGTGYLLRRIAARYPDVHGLGIDLSPNMIRVASDMALTAGFSKLNFVNDDWSNPSNTLRYSLKQHPPSHVFMLSSLHYFSNPAASLRAIAEHLQPGGHLWIFERDRQNSLLNWMWDKAHRHLIKDHVTFFSADLLVDALQKNQFTDIKFIQKLRCWFWHGKIYTNMVLIHARKS